MTELRDDDLRDAFAALNRSVQAPALSFAELASTSRLQSARRRYRARRVSLLVAAVLIPSIVVFRARSTTNFDFERFSTLTGLDPSSVSWQAPTDFLLDLPGSELLDAVPTIDLNVPVTSDDTPRAPRATLTPRRSSDS